MPPKVDEGGGRKETVKQKKERLKREREEREAQERLSLEDQHRAHAHIMALEEDGERWALCYSFAQEKYQMSIDRHFYNELLQRVDDEATRYEEEAQQLRDELTSTRNAKSRLEKELLEIKLDQKLQAQSLPMKMKSLEDTMLTALQNIIDTVEEARVHDTHAVMRSFCFEFGKSRQRYLDILHEMKEKVKHFSQVLTESKSMHSNLPQRIRKELEKTPKEELLFMLDTLSYEEGVMQYFEAKFPKNQPHRWPTAIQPNNRVLDAEADAQQQANALLGASLGADGINRVTSMPVGAGVRAVQHNRTKASPNAASGGGSLPVFSAAALAQAAPPRQEAGASAVD